jgi:ribokinase
MPRKVLFAGDANVDFVMTGLAEAPREDREVLCEGFALALGGSTAIAAAAFARLGGSCDFCGLVGDDENGRFVSAALAEAGVGQGALRVTREAKTGVTLNLARGSTRTQVTYPGTLALVDESDAIGSALGDYSHIHISGPYGTPRFLPRVGGILAAARAAGLTTSLDTQWDPSERWLYADEWMPLLSYLYVNEAEASSLSGTALGDESAAWARLAERTPCPVIKLGPRGAYADGAQYRGYPAQLVDPTGAGDTFAAAFLYAVIEEGALLAEALSFAQAAGALACGFAGGASPLLTRERVRELMRCGR